MRLAVVVLVLVVISSILCGRAPCHSAHNYWSSTASTTLATSAVPQQSQLDSSALELGPTNIPMTTPETFMSNNQKCRICQISCSSSPVLTNCKQRYFNYGCHAKHYCLTKSKATVREFYTGLALCIMYNGCKMKQNFNSAQLNVMTQEGRAKQQLMDTMFKGEKMKKLFTMNDQVEDAYKVSLQGNLTALNTAKVTAFNVLQVKPSFFITYLLVQKAKSERNVWAKALRALPKKYKHRTLKQMVISSPTTVVEERTSTKLDADISAKHRKATIVTNVFFSLQRRSLAANKYDILKKQAKKMKSTHPNFEKFLELMRLKRVSRETAARRIAFHYFYEQYMKLPRGLLIGSDILNDIVLNDGYFIFSNYIEQLAKERDNKLFIEVVYDGIQDFAAKFVSLYNKPNNTEAIHQTINDLKQVGKYCSALLCEMFCKDYVINMAVQKCDYEVKDRGTQLFIDKTIVNGCKEYVDRAYFKSADMEARKNLRYCTQGRKLNERNEICISHSLHSTGNLLQRYCWQNFGYTMLFPVKSIRKQFESNFVHCLKGAKGAYNGKTKLNSYCGLAPYCNVVAKHLFSKKKNIALNC